MKRQLYITGIIFLIMSFINFLGGIVNGYLSYEGNLTVFPDTLVFVGIFCGLYLLSTGIKLKLDNSLKLPIIRTICWTLFVSTELFLHPNIDGEPSYILFLVNSGLCTFWNTIFISIPSGVGQSFFFDTILMNIIAFGLYEIGVIKTATLAYDKLINRNPTNANN